ncbi:hypothetical protein B0T25DRAFT_360943 [Lasiosphaeria hispida]|uniref:Uncharacterized protein n=1 Tax=Lasiosphaeria hispida TaxID=260671 RepID=A0AAJ0H5H7_9PEZI|nr:hypothetical protein B0T25DRAFT_360943 [Lasiosphaeria hispida]
MLICPFLSGPHNHSMPYGGLQLHLPSDNLSKAIICLSQTECSLKINSQPRIRPEFGSAVVPRKSPVSPLHHPRHPGPRRNLRFPSFFPGYSRESIPEQTAGQILQPQTTQVSIPCPFLDTSHNTGHGKGTIRLPRQRHDGVLSLRFPPKVARLLYRTPPGKQRTDDSFALHSVPQDTSMGLRMGASNMNGGSGCVWHVAGMGGHWCVFHPLDGAAA